MPLSLMRTFEGLISLGPGSKECEGEASREVRGGKKKEGEELCLAG